AGTPVLFVPGHLGTYQQARSIGSHLATSGVGLDLFALDFLEEMTAIHASYAWRQAQFLNHALAAIRNLYRGTGGAASVMVVGHSYGGIVARAAVTLTSYRHGDISDIITLGTPHALPAWPLDPSMSSLMADSNSFWSSGAVADISLVSLSGGSADGAVHAELTDASRATPVGHSLTVTTSAMKGVGFGVDHLALVWCGQLVAGVSMLAA
ncbi:unnamed protein product, partial [Chrysoparadoxa australica]